MLGEWVTRLSVPDQQQVVFTNTLKQDSSRLAEYAVWGRLSEAEIGELKKACVRLNEFYTYFDDIPRSSRAVLIADGDPRLLARQLTEPERFDAFVELVRQLKLQVPTGSVEGLRTLVQADYSTFQDMVSRIQLGQRLAISRIDAVLEGRSLHEALAQNTAEFRDALRRSGLSASDKALGRVAAEAKITIDMNRLGLALEVPEVRAAVARRLAIKQADVNLLRVITWVRSKGRAERMSRIVGAAESAGSLTAERVMELAREHARSVALQKAVGDEVPFRRAGLLSLPTRTLWLILVSFLVCVVGISNTMLMSVTDRFTEIATMKCLGAVDAFVMVLFVFEAMLQGVAGSIVGVLLGVVLSLVRGATGFGGLVFDALPLLDMVFVALIAFVTGIVIAALAATWPSWTAARLAPMEAMRVE
jgi:putative ABC transport system permease protein